MTDTSQVELAFVSTEDLYRALCSRFSATAFAFMKEVEGNAHATVHDVWWSGSFPAACGLYRLGANRMEAIEANAYLAGLRRQPSE